MLSGGGRGLLSGPRRIFPLQPLHLETLPKRRATQNGDSTDGLVRDADRCVIMFCVDISGDEEWVHANGDNHKHSG